MIHPKSMHSATPFFNVDFAMSISPIPTTSGGESRGYGRITSGFKLSSPGYKRGLDRQRACPLNLRTHDVVPTCDAFRGLE